MFDLDITPLSAQVLGTALLPFSLRVTAVAMGTVRTIMILRGIVTIFLPQWRTVTTGEAMIPCEGPARVAPHTELLAALRGMDDANVAQVPVIEQDIVVGILSREQARHYIRLRTTLRV